MWILAACIIINAFIGVVFKLFDKYNIDNFQAIVVNYLVCVLTAAVVIGGNPIPSSFVSEPWFPYSLGLGIVFILVFNLMALTVQNFGIVIATVFQKMSLVAPALIAIIYFAEPTGIVKWVGILAALASIILFSYKKSESKDVAKAELKIWILPILTFLFSCIIDSTIFIIEKQGIIEGSSLGFVSFLFLVAGICGSFYLIFITIKSGEKLKRKNIVAGVFLGIPNFFSIYLLILAIQQGLGGSVVFPINNVGVLLVATLFGLVFFGEKLSFQKMIGFLLAILSILFISW